MALPSLPPPLSPPKNTHTQILNVVRSGSAEGLSPLSFELETGGLLVHSAYGYVFGLPFSSYGEACILALQNFFLVGLIYRLSKQPLPRVMLSTAVFTGFVGVVLSGEGDGGTGHG